MPMIVSHCTLHLCEARVNASVRRLVFAGEAIVDVVMRVPALPRRGGDVLATSAEILAGGGFNVMAAAARQGLPAVERRPAGPNA